MDAATMNVMFSSKSDDWTTPQCLFDRLIAIYGRFTLDAAASLENAKCDKFFTKEDDALKQSWDGHIVFVNPPYTRGSIAKFTEKAYQECKNGKCKIVMLIPSRTDTRYFHSRVLNIAEKIYFIQGRVKFENGQTQNSAPFPSLIACYNSDNYCTTTRFYSDTSL